MVAPTPWLLAVSQTGRGAGLDLFLRALVSRADVPLRVLPARRAGLKDCFQPPCGNRPVGIGPVV